MNWLIRGFKLFGILLSLTYLFQSTNLGSKFFSNSIFKNTFLLFSFVDFPFLETKDQTIYNSNLFYTCKDQNDQIFWKSFDYNFSTKLGELKPIGRYIYYFFSTNQRSTDLIAQIKIAKQILCEKNDFTINIYNECSPNQFSIRNLTSKGLMQNEINFSCP